MDSPTLTEAEEPADRLPRARRVVLILCIAWVVIEFARYFLIDVPMEVNAQDAVRVANLVWRIPLVAFLVASLVRPENTRRAFWFLPLHFLTVAGGRAVLWVALSEPSGRALLPLVLAIGLWVCRPRRT
jgi:hypothetical protein